MISSRRGFLTGRFASVDDFDEGDFRRVNPRFEGKNFQRNLDVLAQVNAMAAEKGCTPGQLAIAWLLAQGDDVVPIPGTKRIGYLRENLGAADVELTVDDLARIDQVAPRGFAAGDRYADMSSIGR